MRHAKQSQRLSRPTAHRQAIVDALIRGLILHDQIRTTFARAKATQRAADRLVTLGKDGSIHARRQAFRVLQDQTLVKRLFSEIAPRFLDVGGGYTRVTHLGLRRGDGASLAVVAFSRLPAAEPARPEAPKPPRAPKPSTPTKPEPEKVRREEEKPKKFLEGLRKLWSRQKKGSAAS